eukprot:m.20870 g.20870  ORF g.20870 m.20870 type:complete len:722 (+) comp3836_c0_seq1:77-2242(+)
MWRTAGRDLRRPAALAAARTARSTLGLGSVRAGVQVRWASATTVEERPPPFRKILVANRGEIAVRVLTTARAMGIETVAVYSEADKNSQHVKAADEAFCIGPAESDQSYLRMDKIMDVAERTGSNAVHPGYGFLSENPEFASMLESSGIEFIGPPSSAITSMGEKSESKRIMLAANVPCVPGYHGEIQDDATLKKAADEAGFPLMLKAVVGGGGKGMRIAHTAADFDDALDSARGESRNAFGDDRMLLERYIPRSRHVEVQVFADKHGNVVYLFERDCSVQRRHQKIIEEAPAPGLSPELRRELGEAAVRAAKAVGYVGAGTVEFIMDTADQKFYFMEMNTRLQVEHPVTEMITGQDLVEWQIKVAAGQRLPKLQDELFINGHSFETRVYAEEPLADFRPGSGPLLYMDPPTPSPHVRVDTGVKQGDSVSVYYDPMIAKLVTWGEDRRVALARMTAALKDFHIAGLSTNIDFVGDITITQDFLDGDVSTSFIQENEEALLTPKTLTNDEVVRVALGVALGQAVDRRSERSREADPSSPWSVPSAGYLNMPSSRTVSFSVGPKDYEAIVRTTAADTYEVEVNGTVLHASASMNGSKMTCTVEDRRRVDTVVHINDQVHVFGPDGEVHATLASPDFGDGSMLGSDVVTSPMDGSIKEVLVKPGDEVKEGQIVMTLHAMKVEVKLRAPRDGVVAAVSAAVGSQVTLGTIMMTLEALEEEAAAAE